ncbi:MAG: ferredoxin-type protein NapF [bacterium]
MPWQSSQFFEKCSRCSACIDACSERVLVAGSGGYPQVDFNRGECVFCFDCVEACDKQALDPTLDKPWNLVASISDQCLARHGVVCRTCGDLCEQRAINFLLETGGRSTPSISTVLCTGCGACIAPCPTAAIEMGESE